MVTETAMSPVLVAVRGTRSARYRKARLFLADDRARVYIHAQPTPVLVAEGTVVERSGGGRQPLVLTMTSGEIWTVTERACSCGGGDPLAGFTPEGWPE